MATAQDLNQPGARTMRVPTYLAQSIITMILFPSLIWISWISLMFAINTRGLIHKGDIDAARVSSERARAWAITTYWLGVILYTIIAISVCIFFVLLRNV